MKRAASVLLPAALALAADESGFHAPSMRVCYLDLAAEKAARCAMAPRLTAKAP